MPNVLMQKFPNENFTATAKVEFFPRVKNSKVETGEAGGLAIMGYNFATLQLESRADGIYLVQTECVGANKGNTDVKENAAVKLSNGGPVWLQAEIKMTGAKQPKQKSDYKCKVTFKYSLDGKKFTTFGSPMDVREGHWIGAKVGVFCSRPWKSNDSGWLDVDYFRVTE